MPSGHRIGVIVLAAVGLISAPLPAQQQIGAPDDNKHASQGVYVRDSAVAGEKLALAKRMEHLKEWNKAADVYQEIVEKYADRVVPVPGGSDDAQRYCSVTLTVQELLGKWPADGLRAYRARYEIPAQTLLDAARSGPADDPAGLMHVLQLYFPTDAAKQAGMRLIELDIENGDFAGAAWLGERLLADHPGLGQDRAKLLFRTALAEHLGADDAPAKAKLDELTRNFAGARGKFKGQDVVLADALQQVLAMPAAVAHGASSDSWPTFGGDATRGRVPLSAGRPGAKLVEIPLVHPKQRIPDANMRQQVNNIEKLRRDNGLTLGIVPAVDRGEIFYQDNSRIYAKGLESGFTLPGWTTTYGDESNNRARFAPLGQMLPSSTQLTVTVTDNSVLAVLGQPDRIASANDAPVPVNIAPGIETQLVCLDRSTGARKWSVSPRQFPQPLANLRELDLGGAPLVVGENVYVAARGGKPMQFEDSYVLCFDLANGKLRWACYLASGNAQVDYTGITSSSIVSNLAYAGGRVYCVSNLGAVGAVDAYSGTIAWLTLYPRPVQNQNQFLWALQRGQQMNSGAAAMKKPWAQNPAIVKNGHVFCMPADARNLFIYDAGTGQEIQRISLDDFDNAETLLGIVDEKLIIASARNVYCLDWQKYKAASPSGCIEWVAGMGISGTADENKDTVRGRGFLTTDSLFICNKTNLKRIDLKTGRVVESYPADGWGAGEGPGNVIVTSDQVIVAGDDSINVYSDLGLARAKLDKAIAAAPSDPLPRLKYAETLFAAGQTDAAIAKLDEAIELLGGRGARRPGADRDRAFARSLAFAERLADPKTGASDPAKAAGLYDRAAAAAYSPVQQVSYRLSRARFARSQRDFDSEVRLLEEILQNSTWRPVRVPAEDGSGTTLAGAIAESDISDRIRDYPSAYKPFESAAAEMLKTANGAHDPQQMLEVAQMYPNATVAPQAMLAAADLFEQQSKPRQATQVLNQAYRKYKDSSEKARILEAQARNYLRLPGGVDVAIGRLNEGVKLGLTTLQKPLLLPDGTRIEHVTFGAAADMLQRYSARQASAQLPEFNIPTARQARRAQTFLPEQPQWVISNVDDLVLPPRELREKTRHDRVVTWSKDSGVSIYQVGTNKPLGVCDQLKQAQPVAGFWIDHNFLLWTADSIMMLKGDSGDIAWSVSLQSLPKAEMIEPETIASDDDKPPQDAQADAAFFGGQNVQIVVINGQMMRIRRAGGPMRLGGFRPGVRMVQGARVVVAGAGQNDSEQIDDVRPVGERAILDTTTGRIAAIDLKTGKLTWQTRVSEGPVDQLVANDDFAAARWVDEYGAEVAAFDAFNGQPVYRKLWGPERQSGPLNLVLSPDGALIWTEPDRVCAKDLYEPGKALRFGDSALAEGSRLFEGAIQPDQLVVAEGRILAVADQGQFIRVVSLENGREVSKPLATGDSQNNWNVWMRVVGPRVYVFNSRTLTSYNLDRLDQSWSPFMDSQQSVSVMDAFIGRRHIVLVAQVSDNQETQPLAIQRNQPGFVINGPADDDSKPVPSLRLLAYGRYPSAPGGYYETGRLDQDPDIKNDAGIDPRWQAVEGGFYFRSADDKAHYLKGSATAP
jgi:outer membrane protein assembly factor BamB